MTRPLTVTASNGTEYHLWQLPDESCPEPVDNIEVAKLQNDLVAGYRSSRLIGPATGLRDWKVKLPTLAGKDVPMPFVTAIDGSSVSREDYIRSLWLENQNGTPFVFPDPSTGQYYLADFADEGLSMERLKNYKMYSTGLKIQQRRIPGVTVFDLSISAANDACVFWGDGSSYDGSIWSDLRIGKDPMEAATGDVISVAAAQNGRDIIRFNNTTNNGFLEYIASSFSLYETILVMKMRESAFSNNAGILTHNAATGPKVLTGTNAGTKFENNGNLLTYSLDSTSYATSNMQAPMDAWGIVHARAASGGGSSITSGVRLGQNRTTAGTFAEMDIGELMMFSSLISQTLKREIIEHLFVKWGVTA